MSEREIVCAVCGYRFVPQGEKVCQSCPLAKGCNFVCCPNCGYQNIDPSQSSLGRVATKLKFLFQNEKDENLSSKGGSRKDVL